MGRAVWIGWSLGALLLGGCGAPDLSAIDEGDPIGSLSGAFSCPVTEADAVRYDLGVATLTGALDTADFVPGQRTQGCFARVLDADRGAVLSVVILHHTRYQRAQILELGLPLAVLEAGGPLYEDDRLLFVGRGGFGAMYTLDVGGEPNLFGRVVGGSVQIASWSPSTGDVVAGAFDDLRVGEL